MRFIRPLALSLLCAGIQAQTTSEPDEGASELAQRDFDEGALLDQISKGLGYTTYSKPDFQGDSSWTAVYNKDFQLTLKDQHKYTACLPFSKLAVSAKFDDGLACFLYTDSGCKTLGGRSKFSEMTVQWNPQGTTDVWKDLPQLYWHDKNAPAQSIKCWYNYRPLGAYPHK